MTSRLNPYLVFGGNAREALEFYRDVLGGELMMSTFAEFGTADAGHAGQIMHGQLETPSGFTLMASDAPPGTKDVKVGNNVVVTLSGDDAEELHRYWDRLSESGNVITPLEKQAWGDEFGDCTDRFGVEWMVNIAQPV